jgi:hypothetical protein
MEREDKREEQRVRVAPGQGGVPTKVTVGRDRDKAGVLLLLAPRLVGPVVQVCQVRRALCTELHPGRACKDNLVSAQGREQGAPLKLDTELDRYSGKPLLYSPVHLHLLPSPASWGPSDLVSHSRSVSSASSSVQSWEWQ